MLRTASALLTAFFATLVIAPLVILVSLVSSSSPLIDRLIRVWARLIVAAAGVRIETVGLENVSADGRYVIVANHYSYLDIPCLLAAIDHPLRFMAKKSLFQVPLFGWGLKAAGFIPVDRKNRRTALQSFDMAAKRIRKGNSITVFPEEGRTSTRELKPFQRGAFLLAMRAGLSVIPVALDGTWDVLRVGQTAIRPGNVTVKIGSPIALEGGGSRAKEQLIRQARSEIRQMLGLPDEDPNAAPAPEKQIPEEIQTS